MQKQETKKPKESKKKHKRKVSIFTIFLWLFLIATMSTITIGSLNKKNAIEITDNNWNIQLVMYDRSSDTPDQAITDFSWNATKDSETRQLVMQINYACTTGKEYQPGELEITIPGITNENYSEYNQNQGIWDNSDHYPYVTIAADEESSTNKQYDWSYRYDREENKYIFTNNNLIELNNNFEGTIQLVYDLQSIFKIQTDLEFQAKIKENIQAEEIIAMESNICNFHYTSTKRSYDLTKKAEVAPRTDYTPIEDILDNYYWIRYEFTAKDNYDGAIHAYGEDNYWLGSGFSECIKEELPEGCVLYDKDLNKIEPKETNTYYYLKSSDYNNHNYYYIGYPKSQYNEGDTITNTAELWGRYEDEEEMQKLAEATIESSLVKFDFEYKGDLYSIYKKRDTYAKYYLNQIKSENGVKTDWEYDITAFYTDSIMDVEIGDDLLYITRENGEVTKLEDNEYFFKSMRIPVFYTYNKYSGTIGDPLIGYEWELQVRYANTNEYVSYQTGVTSDKTSGVGFEENVVGIKLIIKNVDKTIYSLKTGSDYPGIDININTQDCVARGYMYNFNYLQVYHKNEEGERTLVNEPTLDSYKTPSALKIAEYDQATYGTYMQRAYTFYNIQDGNCKLRVRKVGGSLQNNVVEEKYQYKYSLITTLWITYYDLNKDVIIKTYDILPEGMNLISNEEEIINNIGLYDRNNAYQNLKLKDGTTFESKEDLVKYIKEHTEVEIDYNYNYQNSERTKISIQYNLNEIDWSYYLVNTLNDQYNSYFYISAYLNIEIPYDSILEYGTSYTNSIYAMWNNQEYSYDYSLGTDKNDLDQDGDITESLTYRIIYLKYNACSILTTGSY